MKIVILHSGNNGFFPRFYKALYNSIISYGDECFLLSPNNGSNKRCVLPNQINWGTRINWHIHNLLYRITGRNDIFSHLSTFDLIRKLTRITPDVIHMHIVNECILNMPMFVRYVNKNNIKIVWTMHDCRAFTGGCPYPDAYNCTQWNTLCTNCPAKQKGNSLIHKSPTFIWNTRYKWHNAFKHLFIITPSEWLANFVRQSFLSDKPLKVIYNGVDTSVFSSANSSDLRDKYYLTDKKIVLGVAHVWEKRKGLEFFIQLRSKLSDEYIIVLIGNLYDNSIKLPPNILHIGITNDVKELASWYRVADVFVNPTLSDNFPTTNIESIAAGTPVVTFKTGGSPEAINEHTGIVIPQGNIQSLCTAVVKICSQPDKYSKNKCIERSKLFSNKQYDKYVELYHQITNK